MSDVQAAQDPDLHVSPWPARVGLVLYLVSMVAFFAILSGWWKL